MRVLNRNRKQCHVAVRSSPQPTVSANTQDVLMQNNIYAAPEANLVDTEAGPVDPAFYVVSPVKFFIFGRATAYAALLGIFLPGE